MKLLVINGTEIKGCTYQIKETFLEKLRTGNDVREFYLPKDLPYFCSGCKACFFQSESLCPHAHAVLPIWEAMLDADLLVFATPVYALRTTAQMKALLDHLCVHWMVHRPDERMFQKRAVILADAVGIFTGSARRDIATSLSWLGISRIHSLGIGLMEGVIWSELSEKRKAAITAKVERFASRCAATAYHRKGLSVWAKFTVSRWMHQAAAKKENPLSADNQHWADKGWIMKKQGEP